MRWTRAALSAFAPLLTLPTICFAQVAPKPVNDLLGVDRLRADLPASGLVPRPAERRGEAWNDWHRVVGEGHLVPHELSEGASFEPDPRRAWFDAETLRFLLSKLGDVPESAISIERDGLGLVVRSEVPERVGVALDALRAGLAPAIHVTVKLEAVSVDTATAILTGEHTFTKGQVATIADFESRSVVADYGVEIAQSAVIANPQVLRYRAGASVSLRVRPIPGRDACLVEAVARRVEPRDGEPVQADSAIGPIERLADDSDECGATFRIGRGDTTRHEWTGRDGRTYRLTCTADWQPPKPPEGSVRVLSMPVVDSPVLDFESLPIGEPEDLPAGSSLAELVESVIENGDDGLIRYVPLRPSEDGAATTTCTCLIVDGDAGQALLARVARAIDSATRPAEVTVAVLDVPAGADVTAGGDPPDGSRTIARATGPTLLEHAICFAGARETSYVRDWDCEVAQAARIADPVVDLAEDGQFLTIRPTTGPDGKAGAVELRVDVERMTSLAKRGLKLDAAMQALAPVTDDHGSPSMWLPQDVVQVEEPVEHRALVHATLTLDADGHAMLRRSAARLLGEGRDLVVLVRVQ